ncbi:putative Cycloartenol synthase [Cardiosporidium cionae]|uniref:Cycloartenol synthase n=1 Tax=Cardiosporidium cionae TaxID=476202 RepID=A0ABQ7JEB6_9APIC|nr:putative Cycloartenol synthase [Cardiosporidium cionae]|eukprot:KAF8822240.1 putative Cycloartenol synthase [Cardiosporidium cionae]
MARKRAKKDEPMDKSTNAENNVMQTSNAARFKECVGNNTPSKVTKRSSASFDHGVSSVQSKGSLKLKSKGFFFQPTELLPSSNACRELPSSETVLLKTEQEKCHENAPASGVNLVHPTSDSDSLSIFHQGDKMKINDFVSAAQHSNNVPFEQNCAPEGVSEDPSIMKLSYCNLKEMPCKDMLKRDDEPPMVRSPRNSDEKRQSVVNMRSESHEKIYNSSSKVTTASTGPQSVKIPPNVSDGMPSREVPNRNLPCSNRSLKGSTRLRKWIMNVGQFFFTLAAVYALFFYRKLRAVVSKYFLWKAKKMSGSPRYPSFPSTTPELQRYTANAIAGWKFIHSPIESIENTKGKDSSPSFPGLQRWIYVGQDNSDSTLPYTSFNSFATPNAQDLPIKQQLLKDKIFPLYHTSPSTVKECCRRGSTYFKLLQCDDGHWAGDYGGPHFLLPGLIIVAHAIGLKFDDHQKRGFLAYLQNHQQNDGGWGIHIEGPSQMYCTSLCYVALRLLGRSPSDPTVLKALNFIQLHGGIIRAPLWSKVLLATIGLYGWEGVTPLPVEMLILPQCFPLSTGKLWCHARVVFVPMAYLYSIRWVAPSNPIIEAMRRELYREDFRLVDWTMARRLPAANIDVYKPVPSWIRLLLEVYGWYDQYLSHWKPFSLVKKHAQRFALKNIQFEDEITHYLNLGPVNKVLNMLVRHIQDPDSMAMVHHIERLTDYLWLAEDGLKMQGEPGAQTWETSFGALALIATGEHEANLKCLKRALFYLEKSQMTQPIVDDKFCWRNRVKGGWGFTVKEQNWPVSDTTAEALLAVLHIQDLEAIPKLITYSRLCDSIDLLIEMQNPCGGWSTYEPYRALPWLEVLNVLEVFGNVMIDYPWLECTASCVVALKEFSTRFPNYRPQEIRRSISKGRDFIISKQAEDGGWYGGWGVCFTYGAMFAAKALQGSSTHDTAARSALKLSCDFLIARQRLDGGWAESFQSCLDHKYVDSEESSSQVVQSAWALSALLYSNCTSKDSVDRAAQFLLKQQDLHGRWHQQRIVGQFNCSTGITYSHFPNIFPLWALTEYLKTR